MSRLVWPALLLCALAACGVDDRPLDARYITDTILAPSCGSVECHSSFVQSNDVVLDTYSAMRDTIVNFQGGLISFSDAPYDPADPADSELITWLTQTDPFGRGIGRMPLDEPMPNADVELLKRWIQGKPNPVDDQMTCVPNVTACPQVSDTCVVPDNATVGECFQITYPTPAFGAECDPSKHGGMACNDRDLVQCGDDWNFGQVLQTCSSGCSEGKCT